MTVLVTTADELVSHSSLGVNASCILPAPALTLHVFNNVCVVAVLMTKVSEIVSHSFLKVNASCILPGPAFILPDRIGCE